MEHEHGCRWWCSRRPTLPSEASAGVFRELEGLFPDAKPLTAHAIISGLESDEILLSYVWTIDRVALLVAHAGGTEGSILSPDRVVTSQVRELVVRVRDRIAARPSGTPLRSDRVALDELLQAILPESIRRPIADARRVVVLMDGPLHDLPFEVLVKRALRGGRRDRQALPSVVYADSATMYLNRRSVDRDSSVGRSHSAVVLGGPIFTRDSGDRRDEHGPTTGVVVASVSSDSLRISSGDVILRYNRTDISGYDDLMKAMEEDTRRVESGERDQRGRVPVTLWREGRETETGLPREVIGCLRFDRRDPATALRALAEERGSFEEQAVEASVVDQVVLFGARLGPLPGSEVEAEQVAAALERSGISTICLVGEAATVADLRCAVRKSPPRYLHLTNHGAMGTTDRPYDASLALTQPATPSLDDLGFLRLEDLIRGWRGALRGTELVVLAACDTQRGVKRGDSVMALPSRFFYAGAPTVIASLWKVDDTATALLMMRLYENLLGVREKPNSKIEALQEAKAWLRGLSREEAEDECNRHGLDPAKVPSHLGRPKREPGAVVSREVPDERGGLEVEPGGAIPAHTKAAEMSRPYKHPYYWSAFVLVGSPE